MLSDQLLVYTGERYSFDQWLLIEHSVSSAPLRIDGKDIPVHSASLQFAHESYWPWFLSKVRLPADFVKINQYLNLVALAFNKKTSADHSWCPHDVTGFKSFSLIELQKIVSRAKTYIFHNF